VTVADPPELEKDISPVGKYPVTVAVHMLDEPTVTVVGAQATEMLLLAGFTITEPLPLPDEKPGEYVLSPEYVAPIEFGELLALVGV
jgi:hypothetical protein